MSRKEEEGKAICEGGEQRHPCFLCRRLRGLRMVTYRQRGGNRPERRARGEGLAMLERLDEPICIDCKPVRERECLIYCQASCQLPYH